MIVYSVEVFSRGPTVRSTEFWMELTGERSSIEPGESRAYSSLNTLVLVVLEELRLVGCPAVLIDPSLEAGCGAIGAVHQHTHS